MNFYYDPIFGLQYTFLGGSIVLDIEALPEEYNLEELFKLMNQQGMLFLESSEYFDSNFKVTNYRL